MEKTLHYNLLFESEETANNMLCKMKERIKEYGKISVQDCYDLAGIHGSSYLKNKIGWTRLDEAKVIRVRSGWTLVLPIPSLFNDECEINYYSPMTLEDILRKYFRVHKVLLNTPKKIFNSYGELEKVNYLTVNGYNAYCKMIDLLYDLERLGVLRNAEQIERKLNAIVNSSV